MKIGSLVKNKFSLILFVFTFVIACNTSDNSGVFTINGYTMGTTYSVKVVSNSKIEINKLKLKIDSLLVSVNNQMSTYIEESEISKFNSLKDTTWFSVSPDFSSVLKTAINIERRTNNIYDITIGPIVNLWGFGPKNKIDVIPTDEEIDKAKKNTGLEKLIVDSTNYRIKKIIPNLYIDLSSIAKGFGVDKVAKYLVTLGYNNVMVEIGGEVRTNGKNNNNDDWKIGISTPTSNGLQKIIKLPDKSVATSGDYLNYFEIDGKRFSHLINPKTGRPINHNLASVSVIYDDCKTADAYATSINVMGEKEGYEFALQNNLSVFMIVRENNKFVEKYTPEFEKYIFER